MEDMMKRKLRYAGHVFRGSSGSSHLQVLEGYVEGKTKGGWTEKNMDEGYYRMGRFGRLRKLKRAAEERKNWKLIVVDLPYRYEYDK